MRSLIAVILLALAAPLAAQEALPSIALPPELARVLSDYEKAWQAKDPAALAELFTEDGFVLANGKPPVRGREAIRAAYADAGGPLALRALAVSTSGDTGYIIGAFSGAANKPDMGKFILAIRKVGDRWLIAADMDNMSSRPQKPAAPPAQ